MTVGEPDGDREAADRDTDRLGEAVGDGETVAVRAKSKRCWGVIACHLAVVTLRSKNGAMFGT